MVVVPSVRSFREQEWRTYRDLRLRALADSPDAYGGTLAGEAIRADATWADRLALGANRRWDLPLLAEVVAEPIGSACRKSDKSEPALANVYQMWVAPTYRGLGAGRLLLDTIIAWATTVNVRCVALGVTCGDTSATRLYMRAGFTPVGEPEPLRLGSGVLAQPMQIQLSGNAE
jgi:GNAT superfamily N-acetyltransferase